MKELKEMLLERYTDFWYDIYNIEKNEVRELKKYIDYVETNLRQYIPLKFSYDSVCALFMSKHLDYIQEAFTSLLLKNYNAFSCVMRIMIENYVSFSLIKKYKKKDIWKDWYMWSMYILVNKVDTEPHHTKIKESYEKLCNKSNISINCIDNNDSYGWLKRVEKLKNYSFKNACKLIDEDIYKDFSYLSSNIHNNDMYTKTNWVDMTLLTKYLFLLYNFTDKMIKAYKPNVIRRKDYNNLSVSFLGSLDDCCNYTENTDI